MKKLIGIVIVLFILSFLFRGMAGVLLDLVFSLFMIAMKLKWIAIGIIIAIVVILFAKK